MKEPADSSKIKSLHITNYYHKNSGGISTSYNNLLDAANRHQRFVRLIVPGEKEEIEDIGEYGKIYYVPAKFSPIFDKRYRIMMPWQFMAEDSIIEKILLAEKPDLIEVTDKYLLALIGAMIRTNNLQALGYRPLLVHFSCERLDDNVASFVSGGKAGRWFARRMISNYILPNFDFHIANSAYTAEELYAALDKSENPRRSDKFFNFCWQFFKAPIVPVKERIAVCPPGVNTARYTPARKSETVKREMRERAGIPADSIVLLYAGRLSPEKNVGLLLDLMKILAKDEKNDYRLLIAGAGPKAEWLKEETEKKCPGRIVQLGHLEKDVLADYYANADVFVHPNPREPFGIAPLEAMASGTPTLAPNAGGILSYATQENAWLVETAAEHFARAVREIIEQPELRERKIANALRTAQANTREISTDRLLATYDEMYEDFQRRNELFTDREQAKRFNFVKFFHLRGAKKKASIR